MAVHNLPGAAVSTGRAGTNASRAAEPRNDTASMANGSHPNRANDQEPAGGPTSHGRYSAAVTIATAVGFRVTAAAASGAAARKAPSPTAEIPLAASSARSPRHCEVCGGDCGPASITSDPAFPDGVLEGR